jgi:hypothetical protein
MSVKTLSFNVALSKERKARALKEAFRQAQMTEEELQKINEKRKSRRNNRPKTEGK